MPSLPAFQADFFAALFGDADAAGRVAIAGQPGFDVYRNTVMSACIDALADNHPTVLQLVGDEWFREAAAVFVRAQPPRDGGLGSYGKGFADFLAGFEPADALVYLPRRGTPRPAVDAIASGRRRAVARSVGACRPAA